MMIGKIGNVVIDVKKIDCPCLYYGKSMYGGWYAQDLRGENYFWAETLRELKAEARKRNVELGIREDH